jgi:hypothetical protein
MQFSYNLKVIHARCVSNIARTADILKCKHNFFKPIKPATRFSYDVICHQADYENTVESRFTNAPCSRTIRFTNKFSEQKVSDYERCLGLRKRKLATAVGDKLRVSV